MSQTSKLENDSKTNSDHHIPKASGSLDDYLTASEGPSLFEIAEILLSTDDDTLPKKKLESIDKSTETAPSAGTAWTTPTTGVSHHQYFTPELQPEQSKDASRANLTTSSTVTAWTTPTTGVSHHQYFTPELKLDKSKDVSRANLTLQSGDVPDRAISVISSLELSSLSAQTFSPSSAESKYSVPSAGETSPKVPLVITLNIFNEDGQSTDLTVSVPVLADTIPHTQCYRSALPILQTINQVVSEETLRLIKLQLKEKVAELQKNYIAPEQAGSRLSKQQNRATQPSASQQSELQQNRGPQTSAPQQLKQQNRAPQTEFQQLELQNRGSQPSPSQQLELENRAPQQAASQRLELENRVPLQKTPQPFEQQNRTPQQEAAVQQFTSSPSIVIRPENSSTNSEQLFHFYVNETKSLATELFSSPFTQSQTDSTSQFPSEDLSLLQHNELLKLLAQQHPSKPLPQQREISLALSPQQAFSSFLAQQRSFSPPLPQQQTFSPPLAQLQTFSPPVFQQQSIKLSLAQQQTFSPPLYQQQNFSPPLIQRQFFSPPKAQQKNVSPPLAQQNDFFAPFIQSQGNASCQAQQLALASCLAQQQTVSSSLAENQKYSDYLDQQQVLPTLNELIATTYYVSTQEPTLSTASTLEQQKSLSVQQTISTVDPTSTFVQQTPHAVQKISSTVQPTSSPAQQATITAHQTPLPVQQIVQPTSQLVQQTSSTVQPTSPSVHQISSTVQSTFLVERRTSVEEQQTSSTVQLTSLPVQQTSSTVQPTSSTVQPTSLPVQQTFSTVQPTSLIERRTSVDEQQTSSTVQLTSLPVQQTFSTVQPTYMPVHQTFSTLQTTSLPVHQTSSTVQPTSLPVQQTSSTVQPTSLPVQLASSTVQPTLPSVQIYSTAQPTSLAVQQTFSTVQPTYMPVQQTFSTVQTTSLPVQQASSTVQPTYLPVQQTFSAVQTTSLPVHQTSSTVQPTSLPVKQTSSTVQPTSLPVQQASSTVQPTSPSVQIYSTAQPTSLAEQQASSTIQPTSLPVQQVSSTIQPSLPVQQASSTIQSISLPVQQTSSTIQPTTLPAQQTPSTVQQTSTPLQQTSSTVQPTSLPAPLTSSAVQQTSSALQPTSLPVQQSSSTVQPTSSTVQQTPLLVQKTSSTVQQTSSAVQHTPDLIQQTSLTAQQTNLPEQQTSSIVQQTSPMKHEQLTSLLNKTSPSVPIKDFCEILKPVYCSEENHLCFKVDIADIQAFLKLGGIKEINTDNPRQYLNDKLESTKVSIESISKENISVKPDERKLLTPISSQHLSPARNIVTDKDTIKNQSKESENLDLLKEDLTRINNSPNEDQVLFTLAQWEAIQSRSRLSIEEKTQDQVINLNNVTPDTVDQDDARLKKRSETSNLAGNKDESLLDLQEKTIQAQKKEGSAINVSDRLPLSNDVSNLSITDINATKFRSVNLTADVVTVTANTVNVSALKAIGPFSNELGLQRFPAQQCELDKRPTSELFKHFNSREDLNSRLQSETTYFQEQGEKTPKGFEKGEQQSKKNISEANPQLFSSAGDLQVEEHFPNVLNQNENKSPRGERRTIQRRLLETEMSALNTILETSKEHLVSQKNNSTIMEGQDGSKRESVVNEASSNGRKFSLKDMGPDLNEASNSGRKSRDATPETNETLSIRRSITYDAASPEIANMENIRSSVAGMKQFFEKRLPMVSPQAQMPSDKVLKQETETVMVERVYDVNNQEQRTNLNADTLSALSKNNPSLRSSNGGQEKVSLQNQTNEKLDIEEAAERQTIVAQPIEPKRASAQQDAAETKPSQKETDACRLKLITECGEEMVCLCYPKKKINDPEPGQSGLNGKNVSGLTDRQPSNSGPNKKQANIVALEEPRPLSQHRPIYCQCCCLAASKDLRSQYHDMCNINKKTYCTCCTCCQGVSDAPSDETLTEAYSKKDPSSQSTRKQCFKTKLDANFTSLHIRIKPNGEFHVCPEDCTCKEVTSNDCLDTSYGVLSEISIDASYTQDETSSSEEYRQKKKCKKVMFSSGATPEDNSSDEQVSDGESRV
ncbi:hypothetical protein Bpfe_029519 [Biomphalaria pfeifferi]|uniref:Uncharacterized protein n=1 Tax=Biomphalaria pfeifferi TaxID=112525 RepID=A0AAD8ASI1_BIOPF|nr:hypothetical protein Bpfe_029519 [Biomphalaria pfeifferi]